MIVQIIGLPGSGKTSLAIALADRINAINLNADTIRATINSDLGFSIEDRIEHSRRLGAIAKILSDQGQNVIVDFVCPTPATRSAFGKPDILVFMNTIETGRFADTNALFEIPEEEIVDIQYDTHGLDADEKALEIIDVFQLPDWKAPTTLLLGRYQPWHEGHEALKDKAHERTKQVVIAVRDTQGTSDKDPLHFKEVVEHIVSGTSDTPFIIKVPNITNIVYGRDVGYTIEQVDLGDEVHSISATEKRKELGI